MKASLSLMDAFMKIVCANNGWISGLIKKQLLVLNTDGYKSQIGELSPLQNKGPTGFLKIRFSQGPSCFLILSAFRIAVNNVCEPVVLIHRTLQSRLKRFIEEKCVGTVALKNVISGIVPVEEQKIKKLKTEYGNQKIGEVTIDVVYNGVRGIPTLVWEISDLDPSKGILLRGYPLPQLLMDLPRSPGTYAPLPEGVFWLLITGHMPNLQQAQSVTCQWTNRATLPQHVKEILRELPPGMPPMAQLSCTLASQSFGPNHDNEGSWQNVYEDVMDIISKLPLIVSSIYRWNLKGDKLFIPQMDPTKDWTANLCCMLGFDYPEFMDFMRLFMALFSDHGGGNVMAHSVSLMGSARVDPYLCLANGVNSMAGCRTGQMTQEVQNFINELKTTLGSCPSNQELKIYVEGLVKKGMTIPGYGHAVLRDKDPRVEILSDFAKKHISGDKDVDIALQLQDVVPNILKSKGSSDSPYPNFYSISGVMLKHYGLREYSFQPVLLATSRAIGTLASLVLSRALKFPIESPSSLPTKTLISIATAQNRV